MDELIRKQDALDALTTYIYNVYKATAGKRMPTDKCRQAAESVLGELPPVQPNRGKWVFKTVFPNDTSEFPMGYLVCSECGSKHSNKTPCNFCDNCGADMRGEADG